MSTRVVGLTGGIGSGKTTVAHLFSDLNIPVYIADVEAKKLMNHSKVLKRHLIALFGTTVYKNEKLNKPFIAKQIFSNKELLSKMNAIVHPKVAKHFKEWLKMQNSAYVIYESALIFENNSQDQFDFIITVTAPIDLRIRRVVSRDASSQEKVKSIISNQLDDEFKVLNSNFVINNINLDDLKHQVHTTHLNIIDLIE